jgi:hypothetical protein
MTVTIAPQFTQRIYQWTSWKAVLLVKPGHAHQWDDDGIVYTIWFYDGPEAFICTIWKGEVPDSVVATSYSQNQNDLDKADFEANFKPSGNNLLEKKQTDGSLHVAQVGREGTEVIFATHDFADPTTWFGDSVRVTDEVLVDSGDGYTFTSSHTNWIDMIHGKVFDEDVHAAEVSHTYSVVTTVDDVSVDHHPPFFTSGGDYSINYEDGTITFVNSQAGKTVKTSYSYENGSTWYMRPLPGKQLKIEQAEAQFSIDTIINDTIQFGAFGLVDVFAPQLVDNPIPSGTLIPLTTTRYKTLDQIVDEAIGSFPVVPALGGALRGNLQARYGFPFRYGAVRVLNSLAGMELRVFLEGNTAFNGERATATFYCSSEDA